VQAQTLANQGDANQKQERQRKDFHGGMAIHEGANGTGVNIITATARITAVIMIAISLAIPTAVMTESSENTTSNITI